MFYFVFKAGGAYAGLVCNNDMIMALILPDKKQAVLKDIKLKYPQARCKNSTFLTGVANKVTMYFDGKTVSFSDTKIDFGSLTTFTKTVLVKTCMIPYGATKSYNWAGSGSARAAGNALGRNPVPVIIPCHRVIKSDGTMGGFAYGDAWKRRLLGIERPNQQKKVLKGACYGKKN